MAEYTHVGPGLPPLHGARANALILGSFPSPKSREQGFFYDHKQNRFWPAFSRSMFSCPMASFIASNPLFGM